MTVQIFATEKVLIENFYARTPQTTVVDSICD